MSRTCAHCPHLTAKTGWCARYRQTLVKEKQIGRHLRCVECVMEEEGMSKWIRVKDRLPKGGTALAADGRVVITAPSSSVTADGPATTHWMPEPSTELEASYGPDSAD